MTKKRLADAVGVSSRSISAYEAGTSEPSEATVKALAAALRFGESFFAGDDLEEVTPDNASFRALSRMTASQRDAALAAGSLAIEVTRWIESYFDLPTPSIPDAHESADPESVAEELRITWQLGQKPIGNIVHLLESRGIRVFSLVEECKEVDAFSLWDGSVPFVFLNTQKSSERSRFDAAHELGHLVLHQHGVPSGRVAEEQANAFASAFLMPRANTIATAPTHPSILGILEGKRRWGVSAMAYAYRLHKLGILSDWYYYHQLVRKMSSRGYRSKEPYSRKRDTSQLLWKVFDNLREAGIRKGDVASELGIYPDELDKLVFGLVLTGMSGGGAGSGERKGHLTLVHSTGE